MNRFSAPDSERPRPEKWGLRAVVIALVAVGPIDAFQTYLLSIALGQPTSWQTIWVRVMTMWLIFPLLIPLAFFMAHRFPLDLPTWRRSVIVHLLTILVLATLHSLLVGLVVPLVQSDPIRLANLRMSFEAEMIRFMRIQLPTDFLGYGALVGFFYASQYYADRQEWELTAAQLKASLNESRFRTLQSQLNPHFLFNTLNAVSALALQGEQRAVVEMLARLGVLLRLALDDTRPQQVTLEDELSFIDRYLDIQRVRFGDRLSITRHVDADAMRAMVPSMLLQPIVENAIKFGISNECGPGSIGIRAVRVNGRLEVCVTDSGPGFKPDAPHVRGNGIGLRNTQARLEQLYGNSGCLEYGDAAGGGAAVTIVMPFVEESPEEKPQQGAAA